MLCLDTERVCRKCGTILIPELNWYKSLQKIHQYACIPCYKTYINANHKKHNYASQRKWTRNHPKETFAYRQLPRVKAHRNRSNIKHRLKRKMLIVRHYSNGTFACANPYNQHKEPYRDIRALTIDHLAGNGAEQKRELGKFGNPFYGWIIRNNFPPGFQVLCANCQFIKRVVNKEW